MFFEQKYLNTFWDSLPHNLALNASEGYLFDNGRDRSFTPIQSELPIPIHSQFKKHKCIINKLVEEKNAYKKLEAKKCSDYKKMQDDIEINKIDNSTYVTLQKGMLEHYLNKDPDKYFNCEYNSYYTGGFLDIIHLEGNEYLVRPNYKNRLILTNIYNPTEILRTPYISKTPIFSLKATKKPHTGTYLTLREKFCTKLIIFNNEENVVEMFSQNTKHPILDARFNSFNLQHFVYISAEMKLVLYDISECRKLGVHHFKDTVETDLFQRCDFIDENTILHTDRKHVRLIDCRCMEVMNVSKPKLRNCNTLCNFLVNKSDLLLATRHYVVKTDLRNMEQSTHFPHTLKSAPCYMDLINNDNDDYLVMAGQNEEEKIVFTGHTIFSLPYKLPSLRTILKKCQLQKDLILFPNVDEKLNYATGGIKLAIVRNEPILYFTNSLGEIFKQKIDTGELKPHKNVRKFFNWLQDSKRDTPTLHVTNVANMSKAWYKLTKDELPEKVLDNRTDNTTSFLNKYEEMYDVKKACEFAKHFLDVWIDEQENDEMQMNDVGENGGKKLPEVEPNDKVNFWIQMQNFQENDPQHVN